MRRAFAANPKRDLVRTAQASARHARECERKTSLPPSFCDQDGLPRSPARTVQRLTGRAIEALPEDNCVIAITSADGTFELRNDTCHIAQVRFSRRRHRSGRHFPSPTTDAVRVTEPT